MLHISGDLCSIRKIMHQIQRGAMAEDQLSAVDADHIPCARILVAVGPSVEADWKVSNRGSFAALVLGRCSRIWLIELWLRPGWEMQACA